MTVYRQKLRYGLGVSATTTALGANDPELGTKIQVGPSEYVLVYNGGNSNAISGNAMVSSGLSGYTLTISSTTSADAVFGFVNNATISTASYGWIVTRGPTNVKAGATSGSIAANELFEIAANGLVVRVSNTTGNVAPAVGFALEAIVSSATGRAWVNCWG